MGQEWAASTPFQFFTDHNEELGPLVTNGRREEFEDFSGFEGEVPDPQARSTFGRSVLDWTEFRRAPHDRVRALYRDVLRLRSDLDAEMTVEAPTEATLSLGRPPLHARINRNGQAEMTRSAEQVLTLHIEQSDDAINPHPPRFGPRPLYSNVLKPLF